ncbi:MAG: hypothetical protein ACR2KZ_05130 [Segetibacter sp.]
MCGMNISKWQGDSSDAVSEVSQTANTCTDTSTRLTTGVTGTA